MTVLIYLFIVLIGYLLGSLNASIELSKLRGVDVRTRGSGNAGATNMARSFGILPALAVLSFDILKAVVSVFLGRFIGGEWGMFAAGLSCFLGHCFPVYYGFRGGKGVSVGVVLAFSVDWVVGLFTVAVFLISVLLSKKVSLGSVCGALGALLLTLALSLSLPRLVLIAAVGLLVIFQHRENIKRLLNGTEPDFKPHSSR